jgi:cellulase/cellobiase CelA1
MLCSRVAIGKIGQQGATGHYALLGTDKNPMRALGIYPQIVGVDDQAFHALKVR